MSESYDSSDRATIPVVSPISNPYWVAVVEAVVLAIANRICYHIDNV